VPEKIDTGYELVVIKGEDRGRSFPLMYREVHLGRKSHPDANDVDWVHLIDPTVSRHHASLIWDDHRRRYVLHHRSRTNPTCLNGQAVLQEELGPHDVVQLGMLTFKVVKRQPPGAPQQTMMHSGPVRRDSIVRDSRTKPDTGFTLVVTAGPDRGRSWLLDQTVIIIGSQQNVEGGRTSQIIQLVDASLPPEQCMLTWYEREKTFGIIQMDRSPVPTVVYRQGQQGPEEATLDSINQILLQADDQIVMGQSALLLQSRRSMRDSGVGRPMAPPIATPPLLSPQQPAVRPAAPEPNYSMAPPRLPAAPPPGPGESLGGSYPPADPGRVPPRYAPGLGTRRTELVDNAGVGYPPPDALNLMPRLSGESAAAARSYPDPYQEAYSGFPPAPSEHSGGPAGYPAAWPAAGNQPGWASTPVAPQPQPLNPGWGPGPMVPPPQQAPMWADPGLSPEHGFSEDPPVPSAVLRQAAAPLWRRNNREPLAPAVTPIERTPRPTADPLEAPRLRGRTEDELPPDRRPQKSSYRPRVDEPVEEERPPARRPTRNEVVDANRVRQAQFEDVLDYREDEAPRQSLPWGRTTAARRQGTDTRGGGSGGNFETSTDRRNVESSTDRPRSPMKGKVMGEPVRPPAPPAKRGLLDEDFGARVVDPDEGPPPRPMESWTPNGERASGVIKKGSSGGPRAMNIIGLGKGGGTTRSPVRFQPPDDQDEVVESLTSSAGGWRFAADFVLGFIEGPLRGAKVELLTEDLSEGHEITIGRRGSRPNDIEINDERVANEQALLLFHQHHFTLVNQASHRPIQVNKLTVAGGEEMLLKHGDHIAVGNSRLIFLERSTVEALIYYELAIVAGVPGDRGRRFDILRERTSIGRSPDLDVVPSDEGVSRRHASLIYREGAFFLLHESGSSPTFVNGVALPKGRERQLNLGDKIQISKATTLVFREKV
jgi:pSer/pThr/pTyr-binding forkhead associated (FHA) protein